MKTALALFFGCAAVSIFLMPVAPPKPNVAVFGRTLRPTPPPIDEKMIVISKRTSLSGEGVFVR